MFSNVFLLGRDFSYSFWIWLMPYQLHFCVFLHTLYCLIHFWPIREEFLLWNSFFTGKFVWFLQNHHSLIHLNIVYLWLRSTCLAMFMHATPRVSWQFGANLRPRDARQVNTGCSLAGAGQLGAELEPSLHQVVFLQVELQDRVFHSRKHEPYVLSVWN